SRVSALSYIAGIPGNKIVRFISGKPENYDYEISIVYKDKIQIRHNAMEAARVAANAFLERKIKGNFAILVRTYPHHVMRENVMATGAGADRVQEGMRKAFGKPIGRAARIQKGQKYMSIFVNKENLELGKEAARRACMKLPGKKRIVVEENPYKKKEN
ncbi:MAG: 50S ribosomal protein L16, partial [Candidatus Altarchaeaceae archaeon]